MLVDRKGSSTRPIVSIVSTFLLGAVAFASGCSSTSGSVTSADGGATSAPVTTKRPADPCSLVPAQLSSTGGRAELVEGLCTDGWALVDTCVDCLGDTWVVARFDGSRWASFLGFPTSVCEEAARAEGVPTAITEHVAWPDCATTTTSPPPTPTPSGVETECGTTGPEWGDPLRIVAIGITCDRASEVLAAYLEAPDAQGSSGHAEVLGFACWSDALPEPAPGDVTTGCDGDEGAVELRIM